MSVSRSRSRTRGARLLSAVAALSMLGAMLPASTAAFSISVSSFMPHWDCTQNWKWKSVGDPYTGLQNNGSFDHCFGVIQLGTPQANGTVVDGDALHDTYIVYLSIDWYTDAIYWGTGEQPMKATLKSSIVGSSSDAEPPTKSDNDCNLSLSVSLGVVGIGLSEELCSGATLKRDSYGSTSAQWSSSDVSRTPHMELTYMVKVNQGVKPTFTATTTYPYYTKYLTGDTFYGHPMTGFKAVMYGSTWVWKRT